MNDAKKVEAALGSAIGALVTCWVGIPDGNHPAVGAAQLWHAERKATLLADWPHLHGVIDTLVGLLNSMNEENERQAQLEQARAGVPALCDASGRLAMTRDLMRSVGPSGASIVLVCPVCAKAMATGGEAPGIIPDHTPNTANTGERNHQ